MSVTLEQQVTVVRKALFPCHLDSELLAQERARNIVQALAWDDEGMPAAIVHAALTPTEAHGGVECERDRKMATGDVCCALAALALPSHMDAWAYAVRLLRSPDRVRELFERIGYRESA